MNLNVSNILDSIGEKESPKPRVVRSSEAQGGLTDEQLLERLLSGQNRESSQDAVRTVSQENQEAIEIEYRNAEIDLISIVESPFPEIDSADVEEQEDASKKYYPSILSLLKYEAGFWICTDGRKFVEQYPAYLWQLKIGYKGKTDKKPEKPASGGGSGGNAVWGEITGTLSVQTDLQNALNEKQGTLIAGSNITIENNVISAIGGGSTYTAGDGIDIDANNEISTNNIIWRVW